MVDWQDYFCKNVHYLRSSNNLTKKKMAQIMGISIASLRKIENENKLPKINCQVLYRLCEYFQISADSLLKEYLTEKPPLK